jgi:hypothetical protein
MLSVQQGRHTHLIIVNRQIKLRRKLHLFESSLGFAVFEEAAQAAHDKLTGS